jgi:hypothetical protein
MRVRFRERRAFINALFCVSHIQTIKNLSIIKQNSAVSWVSCCPNSNNTLPTDHSTPEIINYVEINIFKKFLFYNFLFIYFLFILSLTLVKNICVVKKD